ncbi:MAG: TIGR02391 family protein [Mesorhizobium sp.]|nr:TIGR02391 family protein [Mesorhizobium sp. M6A.T.Cr.TU.016.01.1.1]RWP53513.1 MAG: TIGR02391 family protein [Mesorhizobium sp.]RWQ66212.1 MAG: TIGR02391 family protein [Mesorhizobium sp.]
MPGHLQRARHRTSGGVPNAERRKRLIVLKLSEFIPDAEALIAFEVDELGLRLLPYLARWPRHEHIQLSTLLILVNGNPQAPAHGEGTYPRTFKPGIEEALREAWAWLVGAALLVPHAGYNESIMSLSRRARKLAAEPANQSAHSARRVPKESLHATIREDVWALYHRGKYDTAVFEAMKAVEVTVRNAAALPASLLGVKLMRAAFAPENGQLSDMTVDAGERVARMELFAGAIGSYKNPQSHRKVALDDPDEAAEIIMVANHLLRIVDAMMKKIYP